jgi:hypothetical protein
MKNNMKEEFVTPWYKRLFMGAHFYGKEETKVQLLCNREKNQDKKLEFKSSLKSSSSPIQNPGVVHLKLMPRLHMTSNQSIVGLIGNIRRLSFQWDQSHNQLKY